jgi:hypothetical protein
VVLKILNPLKSDEKKVQEIQKWQLKVSRTSRSKIILSYFFREFLSKNSKMRADQTV